MYSSQASTVSDQKMLAQIGQSVKSHRLRKGWTQLDLALALDNHRTQIARIERGEQDLRICTLTRIAHALEVQVSALIPPPIFSEVEGLSRQHTSRKPSIIPLKMTHLCALGIQFDQIHLRDRFISFYGYEW